MIQFSTFKRLFLSFGLCLLLGEAAFAQSVLNFSRMTLQGGGRASLSVMNPTPYWADVQFTLYGSDGAPVTTGLINPVSYRVAPKGQLAMPASEVFGGSSLTGWVQATSPTSGLRGFSFVGNVPTELEGAEASDAFVRQVIPLVRNEQQYETEILVVNPNPANATWTLTLFNTAGTVMNTVNFNLGPRAAMRYRPTIRQSSAAAGVLSVRIDSSLPVTATGVVRTGESLLLIPGQNIDQPATTRIAAHFVSGSGFSPLLILNNPGGAPVSARVTLFSETGAAVNPALNGPSIKDVSIPARGSISLDPAVLTGMAFPPAIDGWLRVDSPNVALTGIVILDQGQGITGIPLETAASERILFSQIVESAAVYSGISLVNASPETAQVDLYLVREDGTTLASRRMSLPANSKLLNRVNELLPAITGNSDAFVFVRASRGIYGTGIRGAGRFIASMSGMDLPAAYAPDSIVAKPKIDNVDSSGVRAGRALRVSVSNTGNSVTFSLGSQVLPHRAVFPGSPAFDIDLPDLEPGFVTLGLRSDGVEAAPVVIEVPPADNAPRQILSGRAFYQKVEVSDAGLDLSRLSMVPVRNARVEVFDRSSQAVVSVSETDAQGRFRVPVPFQNDLTVRVLSRLRASELRVADNTNNNALYSMSEDVDGRIPNPNILITDNTRVSGAFNILEVIQRGNDLLRIADPAISVPNVTIFWSTANSGTTVFRVSNNTAHVAGDRSDDSDEYDDSVILHEYAHMLAVRFSRDDSRGGTHRVGDMLDPRIAWSEGWASFFSAAARNDAIYRDSRGPNGAGILRYDLEENVTASDRPGYSSEASVQSLLWDLFDGRADNGDSIRFSFRAIWNAFTALRNDRFVYLPHFLDRFLERSPESDTLLRSMVQMRSIDFQPGSRPSVTDPFPRPIDMGETVTGEVDSLTFKRTNLMQSSHFRSFTTAGGAISIRMDISGLGPGNNPAANDLDLLLLDANGQVIGRSARGSNGQSEIISVRLPAGTYVIEVRSFHTRGATNVAAYNSGTYRLAVGAQSSQ